LRRWFSKHGRNYPWRKTTDPYRILVSEYLLQQTNAELALPAYRRFIKDYPTPQILAQTDIRKLRRLIAPIGLSYRAYRLKIIGQQLVSEFVGKVPQTRDKLLKLHGVGLYMSNAVLSFAFEERVPILDTNTIRIFERVFGIVSDLKRPRTDKKLENRIKDYLPNRKVREFNYALLDFGALICTSTNPKCSACPLCGICDYAQANVTECGA